MTGKRYLGEFANRQEMNTQVLLIQRDFWELVYCDNSHYWLAVVVMTGTSVKYPRTYDDFPLDAI